MRLLSVEAARERILAAVSPLPATSVALDDALGRTLAGAVAATRDQPPFPASAMDGWAVRADDGEGFKTIVGESAAGRGWTGRLGGGQAVRIFTGAPVPAGADAVVIQEDARRQGERVWTPAVKPGRHVRPAGLDFTAGQFLLAAGSRLDPWRLSLAAAAGLARLDVATAPRVTVLATGEEVAPPGGAPGPFQIFDSGSTALTALVREWGGVPEALTPVRDDVEAITQAVGASGGDLVVTLGGASVGDYDLVRPALDRLGLDLRVASVAVRPGKPTWFGVLGDGRPVLGLPGNPASAMVCAELFLRSILRAMQGADPGPFLGRARTAVPLAANGDREHWMRGRRVTHAQDGERIEPLDNQDSSLVTVFAAADVLIRRRVGAPAAAAGDLIDCLTLDRAV